MPGGKVLVRTVLYRVANLRRYVLSDRASSPEWAWDKCCLEQCGTARRAVVRRME